MVLEAPVTTTRILVIEDDPTVAEVVARYLAREATRSTWCPMAPRD